MSVDVETESENWNFLKYGRTGKLCQDECYQMATEFQETCLRPDISVTCSRHVIRPLPVTSVQLMTPGIGRNASCALGDFYFYN